MRRRYITHPDFQYSFTFSFLLGIGAIFVLMGGGAVGTLYLLYHDPTLSSDQKILLLGGIKFFALFLLDLVIPSLILFSFLGVYLSYKFVGPLSRVERWLEEILLSGSVLPLRLRPGDELLPMVEILTRQIQKLKLSRKF